ncbi:MAG: response regulator, partial [Spirochaetia bacterium]|nr:response regulator [Spirochaetia bacterium]
MTEAHSILIVEDDTEFQTTLLDFFRSQSPDYRVSAVPSLPETLPALRENTPDVVLLDLKLGKDSGLDVLKLLRKDERFRNTRVIVVTGDRNLERRKETLALGADDFLSKPLALRDLEEVLVKIKMNRYSTQGAADLDERATAQKKKQVHREVLVFSKSGSEGPRINDFLDVRFQRDRLLMILAEVSGNGQDQIRAAALLKSLSDRLLPLLLETRTDLYLSALNERLAAESLTHLVPRVMAAVLDLGGRTLH